MNIEISEIDSESLDAAAEPGEKPAKEPRRGGFGLAFLALLTALVALLGTAWMWWQGAAAGDSAEALARSEIARLESSDSRLSAQLEEVQAAVDARPGDDVATRLVELQDRLADDQAQAAALQQALQEQATVARSLQSAVDAMHGRLLAAETALANVHARELDAGADLDLAEVDYLLRLASERLQLFGDPRGADRALALADGHLAALENPSYLGVRQAIAAARGDLAAIDTPDDLEIARQLEAIQKTIPALPFRPAATVAMEAAPSAEAGWWEKLKDTLSSLVTVRRSTEEENRRISLQDEDYIRQRVWLQVEVAWLALMRREQEAFHAALGRVEASIAEWFDPASSEVREVKQSLDALLGLDIAVAWPDISEPWTTLRLVRSAQSAVGVAAPVDNKGEGRQ